MLTNLSSEMLLFLLKDFIGTEHYYKHPVKTDLLITDGVKFFFEQTDSFWLFNLIAEEYFQLLSSYNFLLFNIYGSSSDDGEISRIQLTDGNGQIIAFQVINFQKLLPKGVWNFYLTNNVLMLPSEY
ncbi:DUF6876 family protein [Methylomonas sp. AM2-LC]|uniref:DUF6876 family protein n=1 Tax=Methylomonas sp. AM2-LC TaxID=3153301 RepID=UPI003263589F